MSLQITTKKESLKHKNKTMETNHRQKDEPPNRSCGHYSAALILSEETDPRFWGVSFKQKNIRFAVEQTRLPSKAGGESKFTALISSQWPEPPQPEPPHEA
jgi:hypothetical protein